MPPTDYEDDDPDFAPGARHSPHARRDLAQAARLFRRGRWSKAIALLEPLVVQYRDSRDFHYILGASCLAMGDTGGAFVHLRRARQLDFRHVPTVLALAAAHARRLETDKAVELYLEALELRPGERRAEEGLEFLRKNADPDRLADLAQSGRIAVLYPRPDLLAAYAPWLLGIAAAAAIAVLAPLALGLVREALVSARPSRPGVAAVSLGEEEFAAPVTTGGNFRYVLSEKEALAAFEEAKGLLERYRDEAAMVEINRLLLSNAARSLKAKAAELRAFVRVPDFVSLPDRFAYADAIRDPALFEGVGVAWKGMAANVAAGPKGPSFDLLVGYHDRSRLEGIVRVELGFPAVVDPDRPIEVLGRIVPAPGGLSLEGLAVHDLRD